MNDVQTPSGHVEEVEPVGVEPVEPERAHPEVSELGQIAEMFQKEQESREFTIAIPGYGGQFEIACHPVSDSAYKRIEKGLENAGKRDDNKLRNYKLDTLIAGTREIRVAAREGKPAKSLQQVAPEIVGTDETPIRFGDSRFSAFLSALGANGCDTARQQLLKLLKSEPIRLQNVFGEYYEHASGEAEDVAEELQGE